MIEKLPLSKTTPQVGGYEFTDRRGSGITMVMCPDCGEFLFNSPSDKKHVDWVKAYLSIWTELQAYIKEFHTTGLAWSKTVSEPFFPPSIPPGQGSTSFLDFGATKVQEGMLVFTVESRKKRGEKTKV